MDRTIFFLVLAVTLLQLADAYLRYLAFRDRMEKAEIRRLWKHFALWGLFSSGLYGWMFYQMGVVVAAYKIALMLGWIPYLAIFMHAVRHQVCQHVFVFGMSAIWSFMQHSWSSILVALFLMESRESTVILVHSWLYILWFALLLPLERRLFRNLLPSGRFFDQRPVGIYIAVLPLAILSAHWIMWADDILWHTWEERLSRLYMPIVFFFFYRYVLIAAKHFYAGQRLERSTQLLEKQLFSLEEYQRFMQESQDTVIALRHDLKESYQKLHALIEEGKVAEAKEYIRTQEKRLDATVIRPFSDLPLVNAALSVYLRHAEKMGIRVRQKVNLPERLSADENDVAVLLSNLLENAVRASKEQPPNARGIELVIQHDGKQCALSISNRYDAPLRLGEDGVPHSSRTGHGIGMISLKAFLRKYNGYAIFSQKSGWVRLLMYWKDESS